MARNEKQNGKTTRENRAPAYIAFHVSGNGNKGFWTRIGAAWHHEDGVGLTLQLDLVPVKEGRIVLRTPKDKTEAETAEEGAGA